MKLTCEPCDYLDRPGATYVIRCTAPPSLFREDWDWREASEEVMRVLNAQGGTPCGGGGEVGEWCVRCHWMRWEEE